MKKHDIPIPTCGTCREYGEQSYSLGETTYLCDTCGTEMRYRPAGELLHSGGRNKEKGYNGWVTGFSVRSSEAYSAQAVFVLGIVIILVALSFLWLGTIEVEAALWSIGSGVFLAVLGKRRSVRQKKKIKLALEKYPYWGSQS